MRYPRAIIRAIILSLNAAGLMIRLSMHSIIVGKSDALGFKYRRKFARAGVRILGIKIVEIDVYQPDVTVLYVSNHRTLTDPIIQASFFDSYIIAKNEVGSIPILGKGAEMTGIILVKREKLKSRLEARNQTKELLISGKSVLVYAEGTTGINRISDPFKIGTFKAAAELGIPVVPIAIDYRDPKDYWQKSSMAEQVINQIGAPSTYVKMKMGKAIYAESAQELMNESKEWIDQQLLLMQKDWSTMFPD
jgi:lyso-ornithine lipid O-acyltransferase